MSNFKTGEKGVAHMSAGERQWKEVMEVFSWENAMSVMVEEVGRMSC